MATDDFAGIIQKTLQPYQAKFAELSMAPGAAPKPKLSTEGIPPLTKEEVESEKNKLLADSVSPDIFDKVMTVMNKTAERLTFPMPKPLAGGGNPIPGNRYLVGEKGVEYLATPFGGEYVGVNGPEVISPTVPGYVVPNDQLPIPRGHGGWIGSRSTGSFPTVGWQLSPFGKHDYAGATWLNQGNPLMLRGNPPAFHEKEPIPNFNPKTNTWDFSATGALFGTGMGPVNAILDQHYGPKITDEQRERMKYFPGREHYAPDYVPWPIQSRQEGGEVYPEPEDYADFVKWRTSNPYSPWISEAAKRYGVPEDVAHAVAWQESRGNPNAISRKGARGIFQIMPETEKEPFLQKIEYPYEPVRQNIHRGVAYLGDMARRFGGDWTTALSAYNRGPTAEAEGRERPAETTDYLRRIGGYLKGLFGMSSAYAGEMNPKTPVANVETPVPPAKEGVWDYLKRVYRENQEKRGSDVLGVPGKDFIKELGPPIPTHGMYGEPYGSKPGIFSGEARAQAQEEYRRYLENPSTYYETGNVPSAAVASPTEAAKWRRLESESVPPSAPATPIPVPAMSTFAPGPAPVPAGWTEEEMGFKGIPATSPIRKWPWAVEVIRGTPYSERYMMTSKGPVAIPGGTHTFAGPGGELPLPGYEKRWGLGRYSPDFQPKITKAYDAAGNEITLSYNPETGAFEKISEGVVPGTRGRTFEQDLTLTAIKELMDPKNDPRQKILPGMKPTPQEQAQIDAYDRMVERLQGLMERGMGMTAPPALPDLPSWEDYYRKVRGSGKKNPITGQDYSDRDIYESFLSIIQRREQMLSGGRI